MTAEPFPTTIFRLMCWNSVSPPSSAACTIAKQSRHVALLSRPQPGCWGEDTHREVHDDGEKAVAPLLVVLRWVRSGVEVVVVLCKLLPLGIVKHLLHVVAC